MSIDRFCRGFLSDLSAQGYDVVVVSSPGRELATIAERERVRTVELPMERHISVLKDMRSVWRMIKILKRETPEIVHSITPKAGLVTMMAAWVAGVPIRVHTFTGLIFPTSRGVKKRLLKTIDKLMCRFATHVVAEGNGVRNLLQQNKVTRKPIRVLGNGSIAGVDVDFFNVDAVDSSSAMRDAAELNTSEINPEKIDEIKRFTFIFVGRLVGDKGVNELVAAFSRLSEEDGGCQLLLVGESERTLDPLKPATECIMDTNPDIVRVGNRDDVRPWLLRADVLVLPSYREGFPNVVLEAGAMGKPSIVTDVPGSNEIISTGFNGLIVPAYDSEGLYLAMKTLMNNPATARQMGVNARKNVVDKYNRKYVHQCASEFYKELVSEAGGAVLSHKSAIVDGNG